MVDVAKLTYLIGGTPGIPPEIAQILRDAFQKTLKDPEFVKKMEEAGGGQPLDPANDQEAAKQIQDSLKTFVKYKDLVESAKK